MEKTVIDALRKAFTISVAAFEFQKAIVTSLLGKPSLDYFTTHMMRLHKLMLDELNNEQVNEKEVMELLKCMEALAAKHHHFNFDDVKAVTPKP
jgi:hypothetical protein